MQNSHYVDYDFYTGEYGGSSVTEDRFNEYERRSRMVIDKHTFNRVRIATQDVPGFVVPYEIKIAQCAVMDELCKDDMQGGAVASETVSRHSVTFLGVKTVDQSVRDVIKMHLGGTAWTYCGRGKGYVD